MSPDTGLIVFSINTLRGGRTQGVIVKKIICCSLGIFLATQLSATELDTIQVTANRHAQTADETLAPVTIINRDEIALSAAKDLPELLQALPGISIAQTGGPGQLASLFMRGTESDHTLVLIDGVRIGSVSTGAAALHFLPLDQIEKIEIVRGPRSSLYGSEAIGGVIQIFTRRKNKSGLYASLSSGSYQTGKGDLGFDLVQKNTSLGLTLAGEKTDGINAFKTADPDKDGYENTSFNAHIKHQLSDATKLQINALRAEGENNFDNTFNPSSKESSDFVQQVINARFDFMPSDKFNFSFTAGKNQDELETQGSFPSTFDTEINQLSTQINYFLNDNQQLTTGIDYRDDRLKSTTAFDENSRDNLGLFAAWFGEFDRNHLNISLRNDDNEAFGNHTMGSLEYGFDINKQLRLTAAYGTAFKSPTFNDLYFPDSAFFTSNPNLDPETSESFEIGLRGNQTLYHWQVNAYRTNIEDMIAFTSDPVTFLGTVDNIDEAKINGLEIEGNTTLKGHKVSLSYSYIDSENNKTGQALLRRPKNTTRLDVSRSFKNFSANLNLSYNGSREDLDFSSFPAQRVKLGSYSLLNIGMQYQLTTQWKLFAKLNNLLDKEYETVFGYNRPGFNGYIGLSYNQ